MQMQNNEFMVILDFMGSLIGFLGFVFLLVLAIVVIAGVAIRNFIYRMLGGRGFNPESNRRYDNSRNDNRRSESYADNSDNNTRPRKNGQKPGKIFGKDEGKYVDFVEIKD